MKTAWRLQDKGVILNSPLQTVHAEIKSLEPISPLLLNGSLKGPAQDALRVLQSKALNQKLGYLADAFSLTGQSRTELKLQVPLALPMMRPMRLMGQFILMITT